MLERLQRKQESVLVGIWGVHSGAGVTTMTVALANYLAGFLGKKVAVYEYSHKNDFAKIYESICACKLQETSGSFVYEKVTYYMKGSTSIQKLQSESYDVIVIDFGSYMSVADEFLRCQHKIVISSMEPWYCGRYEEFCESLAAYQGSDLWLHIIGSDADDVKRVKRTYEVVAVERPSINNAYVIDKSLIKFFQSLYL